MDDSMTRRDPSPDGLRPREPTIERLAGDWWQRSCEDPVLDPTERVMLERALFDIEHVLRADDVARAEALARRIA
jgi:hypothetical protein